ncbi:protein-L-isoaspartate(D-aspartate) O-methyltransferase [Ferrovibrio terrae]|uniref:Protein-L-isoaspartate O-methyltransferase n=1 Tax=Ferrovibrio terrae TaxID=2594003 RepID=A0A516H7Q7_9PROT|nr:protein-L-isoaspartate(D-aspartate) O-methyltransferase [Ferrovibrio terrae]QDO99804.1 protein-L-isoaspartate(D-aspartate) O-methyltransferase [Ferrovibrio terrae]
MDTRVIQLLMELRKQGIGDTRVLAAMERVPREQFVAEQFLKHAYDNIALPITQGQTISQPYVVAYMTEALKLTDRMKVLEIGTGSGYQTAVLARLSRRVYTIERYRSLLTTAEKRLNELKITNVVTKLGDGNKGWIEQAPFDRILVTAAADTRPDGLIAQLSPNGGIMVAPVAVNTTEQDVIRYTREGDDIREERLLPVRFVPLLPGIAREAAT